MARPTKNTVDYFPHDCLHGRKMHIIETKYGNDGYAVWFKILEQLGLSENHYIDLREETQIMYLESILKIDEKLMWQILSDLAKLNAIDKDLYEENIIWSEKFTDSIMDAYKRRSVVIADKNYILKELLHTETHLNGVNAGIKPQTKVKETKGNKKKENNIPKTSVFRSNKISETLKKESSWKEVVCMHEKIKPDKIDWYLDEFQKELEMSGDEFKSMQGAKNHFKNWYRKVKNDLKPEKDTSHLRTF